MDSLPARDVSEEARAETSQEIEPAPRILVPVAPPWRAHLNRKVEVNQAARPRLRRTGQARNQITDEERWFEEHEVDLGTWEVPRPPLGSRPAQPGNLPSFISPESGTLPVVRAYRSGPYAFAMYGEGFSPVHLTIFELASEQIVARFDFSNYQTPPPVSEPSNIDDMTLDITWAVVENGILFVSHSHRGYATVTQGRNAYISALSVETGELLWRSRPLVANSRNFLLQAGWIITGYGFTAEDDYIYVLDARNGQVVKRVTTRTGPDYFFARGDQLFVRCYDTDYEFQL